MWANIAVGLFALVTPIVGCVILHLVKNLSTHNVEMGQEGFIFTMAGETDICHWTDVEEREQAIRFTMETNVIITLCPTKAAKGKKYTES